jgi:hypothetical protein
MFFDVRHPMVRSIRFASAVRQQQDGSSRREGISHLAPIGRVIGFVGSLWIPRLMVDLVKVALGIGGDKMLRQFSVRRIRGVDRCLAKFYDRNNLFSL